MMGQSSSEPPSLVSCNEETNLDINEREEAIESEKIKLHTW